MSDQKLFGNQITPACAYCHRNTIQNGTLRCTISSAGKGQLQQKKETDSCPFFDYDPLQRKPSVLPPLGQFDPTDFSL